MRCLTCGRQSKDDKRFCVDCGTEIRNLPPRSYTPKHLADKILQSKSALEGERKQVTVLFADVVGIDRMPIQRAV